MEHKLFNKDCIEFLKTLDDESVDLVVVDPPYFEIVKNSWDNQWDSEQEYLEWCEAWTLECVRVLKPNKPIYVWGTTKTDTFLKYKLEVLNSIKGIQYENWIIWSYDWGGRTKKKFARKHEDLLVYSKGKNMDFFADNVLVERAVKTNMNIERKINLLQKYVENSDTSKWSDKDQHSWEKYKYDAKSDEELVQELEKQRGKSTAFAKGKIPTDVWQKNNHTTSKEYAGWHPTQKPLELMERIIKAHTKEGDVVLDCFGGSGSTMIAAARCSRSFIGSEMDSEYCDKSAERYEELVPEDKKGLILA